MKLNDLLGKGYFPKELPPIFSTQKFADFITSCENIIPSPKTSSKCMRLYIPKNSHFKRLLTIPNPYHYYILSSHMMSNYEEINTVFKKSCHSYSIPEFIDTENRSISPSKSYNSYIKDRVIKTCGHRFVLTTDISRYYQSIYTHSIPWALLGKDVAKASKHSDNFSNRLDQHFRNIQDMQTFGIPTGPDSSRIISELILCDIDRMLLEKFPNLIFLRYVDDYTIPCKSSSQAKEILNELTRIFNSYELDINESKTQIVELPIEIEYDWLSALKSKKISSGIKRQESDLIAYYNLAFDMYKKYPAKNVLHYALIEKLPVKIYEENWELFESLILQTTVYEPRVLPIVGRLLITYKELGYSLNTTLIHNTLLNEFKEKVLNFKTFELLWPIYILCQLEININITLDDFIYTEDTLFLLIMMYAKDKGFYNGKIARGDWQKYMEPESLFSNSWLFSYECNIRDWLKNKKGKDISSLDPFFKQLKDNNVSFLDLDVSLKTIASKFLEHDYDEEEYDDEEEEYNISHILYDDFDDLEILEEEEVEVEEYKSIFDYH